MLNRSNINIFYIDLQTLFLLLAPIGILDTLDLCGTCFNCKSRAFENKETISQVFNFLRSKFKIHVNYENWRRATNQIEVYMFS